MDRYRSMNNQKIVYVLDSFPLLSQTFVLQEILELQRQGLSLHVFSLSKPPEAEMAHGSWSGLIPITYVSQHHKLSLMIMLARRFFTAPRRFLHTTLLTVLHHRLRPAIAYLCYGVFIAEQIEHQGIDHLHAHFAMGATSVAQIVHLLTGTRYSFMTHAYDIYLAQSSTLAYKMRYAHFVATCSLYNQHYLQELVDWHTGKRVYCIYVGLNLGLFPAHTQTLPYSSSHYSSSHYSSSHYSSSHYSSSHSGKPPLILAVCRLVEKKGLLYLLQACRILKDQGYSFLCHIAGEGPQRPLLEQKISELALTDCVELAGAASHEQVIAMYQQATVVALPCVVAENGDRDGIPNVLMEALYMQIPVVSTPVSGIPELISAEQNGLLVPPRDSPALSSALARLLDDPALRTCLADAGRETIRERFDVAKNARTLIALFAGADVERTSNDDRLSIRADSLLS
jgi:glycosyltransferase involved in cell wall biosynthesis